MHCNTFKHDNDSTVRGDGGSRVGEVRAGTTSPMPEHKGFKLQELSRDPLTPAVGPGSVSVKWLRFITQSRNVQCRPTLSTNKLIQSLLMCILHIWKLPPFTAQLPVYTQTIKVSNLQFTQREQTTIHQLTSMLETSKNVLFPGHNHPLTTSADDLTI